jgi:hypothetical protein
VEEDRYLFPVIFHFIMFNIAIARHHSLQLITESAFVTKPQMFCSCSYFSFQKEYTHYKQLQGQKHLVVYKSGIHGLGLYTSMFISRGSMVIHQFHFFLSCNGIGRY